MPVPPLLSHASRAIRRHPWHSLGVALLLALGLGPVLALSALGERLLVRNAPYPAPRQVVQVLGVSPDFDRCQFNATSFRQLREGLSVFSALALLEPASFALGRGVDSVPVEGVRATADFGRVLGTPALAGRLTFLPEEDTFGGLRAVIVTERAWRRRHGADPALVGRSILLDGLPTPVVGILPEGTSLPTARIADADYIVPAAFTPLERQETGNNWEVIGRLAPSAGGPQVQAALATLAASKVIQGRTGFRAVPVGTELARAWKGPLALFGAASLLLLLLSGINAAYLVLARSEARRGDLAVAAALGASADHMVGRHLLEGLGLGLLGLGLGFGVATGVRHLLVLHFALPSTPPFTCWTLGAGALASLFLLLAASAIPAWVAARVSPMEALKGSGRGTVSGGRSWVLVGELCVASVLLVGAGLLVRTLQVLGNLPSGVRNPGQVLAVTVRLPSGTYPTAPSRQALFERLGTALPSLPGVRQAALAQTVPFFKPNGHGLWSTPDGRTLKVHVHGMMGNLPGALGLQLREGRLPLPGAREALVSDTLAKDLGEGGSALGRVIMGGSSVVGVVSASAERDPRLGFARQAWRPLHAEWDFVDILLRTEAPPETLLPPLRALLGQVGPGLQLLEPTRLSEAIARSHQESRKAAQLLGGLALLALLLAAAGVYGVASQLTLRRRREFGMRTVLGATPGALARLVLNQGLRMVALGLGLGLLASLWATMLLKGLLHGVARLDPVSYLGGGLLLLATALLALLFPALRAARLHPSEALRGD